MLKNYLKVSIRNLFKNKAFTLINVFGLSFGIACFIFISLWVWDEVSHDQFHKNSNNIYQLFAEKNVTGESHVVPYIPSSLVEHLSDQVPEINNITRVFPAEVVFEKETLKFSEKGIYADPSFLKIFSFPLKEGTLENILKDPRAIVITADLAAKYFPHESALGQHIDIVQNKKEQYVIAGILEKIPAQSSLKFDFIMAYDHFETTFRPWWKNSNEASYSNFNVRAYVETKENANVKALTHNINNVLKQYSHEESDALFTYPFRDVYLHSDFSEGRHPTGRVQYVYLLSVIAIAVLLIACINFINLSIVMASKRRLEAGLRKVVGASKKQILFQFLTESVLIALASVLLAITAVEILLPVFNVLTHKTIAVPFHSFDFLCLMMGGGVLTGLAAGIYPALHFSSFKFFNTERNAPSKGLTGLKKVLVIIQFTCSVVFIVFTLVVYQQVNYINSKALGIRTQNIITHPLHGIRGHQKVYRSELLRIPGVEEVSFTEQDPIATSNKNDGAWWQDKPEDTPLYFNVIQVSQDFLQTFDIKLLAGKNFYSSNNDETQFIINEAAARQIMAKDIIGLDLTVWGHKGKIIGVVEDYHHQSLMQHIEPVIILLNPDETWNAYISFESDDKSALLKSVDAVYSKYEPEYPFDFSFVSDQYLRKYNEVSDAGNLSITFTMAAILISCLGLFGLSAFVMQQRSKETGIRKVLGASAFNLIYLFSSKFVKLVLISLCVALPVAWFYSQSWLSGFAYHIKLGIAPFIMASIVVLVLAITAVIYNTLKAALTNPVDTLKEE